MYALNVKNIIENFKSLSCIITIYNNFDIRLHEHK